MLPSRALASLVFVLACSSTAFASHHVITVGPFTTADFFRLQDAVNAAADGDLLLVHYQQYDETVIDGKSLTLIGDGTPVRPIVHRLVIKNLAANQKVVVRGIDSWAVILFVPDLIEITNCAGPVFFEDCALAPIAALPGAQPGGAPRIAITHASHVIFTRCTLSSPPGANAGLGSVFLPGAEMRIEDASVALYDCAVSGGDGAAAFFPVAFSPPLVSMAGAPAIEFVSGTLFLAGCMVAGGAGGDGAFLQSTCYAPSSGGDGIQVGGLLRRMDTTIAGGAVGVAAGGCPGAGSAGADVVLNPGGSVIALPDALRRFQATSPGIEGTNVGNTVAGVTGEPVLLLFSQIPDGGYVPGLRGALIAGAPFAAFFLGTIPPGGTMAFSVLVPVNGLPPGIEGIELYEQCAVPGSTGVGLLTTPCVVVLIDDAV